MPAVQILRPIIIAALVILSVTAGIMAALRLRPVSESHSGRYSNVIQPLDSQFASPPQASTELAGLNRGSEAQANILELPKASKDFVGFWGGYIHSSIERLSPELTGSSPDHVSVVFGRQGDTVFMASELYTSRSQRVVRKARARIISARNAIIDYESADENFYYICSHSFLLRDSSTISYKAIIKVYDARSHRLMGIVTQRSILKRLVTAREQLHFARPARNQIPRNQVSAQSSLTP